MQSGGTVQQLYKYQQDRTEASWELCLSNIDWGFYVSEGSAGKHEWHLEVGPHIDIPVFDDIKVIESQKQVTLLADTVVYALKFLSLAALQTFVTEYNAKLSFNTAGTENQMVSKQMVSQALLHDAGKRIK